MGSLNKAGARSLLAIVLVSCPAGQQAAPDPQTPQNNSPSRALFAQSAIRVLDREFGNTDVSYLLLDARSGVLLASRWEDARKPIPLGSLVKPFTALAYASRHDFQYPSHECKGEASGCWQARPHGHLDMISAIAVSCNSYFRVLTKDLTGEELVSTAEIFDLESPGSTLSGASLMGLGDDWRISPLRMARAYPELFRRREQPGVRELLEGMAQSAQRGTGAAVGAALKRSKALVKTGTAICTHPRHGEADGFVVAMVPANDPEILLMIRVHGVAGAKASETAGRMLSRMEE